MELSALSLFPGSPLGGPGYSQALSGIHDLTVTHGGCYVYRCLKLFQFRDEGYLTLVLSLMETDGQNFSCFLVGWLIILGDYLAFYYVTHLTFAKFPGNF